MRPTVGSRPQRTPKRYLRMIARKKIGIEIPISEPTRLRWSKSFPCLFAARKPRGMPSVPATSIAATASSNVAGNRCLISYQICRCEATEVPRSRCTTVFRYAQYWT